MKRQIHREDTSVLTVEQRHRNWLRTLPQLKREAQEALIERAQAGENVRDEVLLSLQLPLFALSGHYMRRDKATERMDLVQAANVAMWSQFHVALTKHKPLPYLLGIARLSMVDCVNGRNDLIKTSHPEDNIRVASLDEPVYEDGTSLGDLLAADDAIRLSPQQEAVAVFVQQAVEALPEKQRLVIERRYGLGEHAPISLNEISRWLSPHTCRPCTAHYHHKHALVTLNATLATVFPQYCAGGVQ